MRSLLFPAMLLGIVVPPLLTSSLASAARASLPVASEPTAETTVGVFFEFEDRPSDSMVLWIEAEVGSIMRSTGLSFVWHPLSESQGDSTFSDLVVIRFRGSCSGPLAPLSELGPNDDLSLASTKTSNGKILHFTDVQCDELRRYLAVEVAQLGEPQRDIVYGKALGRIVSHEMYHIFAATEKHASGGVARACHSRRELVQPVFDFTPKETQILRDFSVRTSTGREPDLRP